MENQPQEFDGNSKMALLMRVCQFLTTAIVTLLLYQAQQILDHQKDMDARLSSVALHQVSTDSEVQTLHTISTDQGKRLDRLEQHFFDNTNTKGK